MQYSVHKIFVNKVLVQKISNDPGQDGLFDTPSELPDTLPSVSSVDDRILRSLRRISRAIELHSKQLKSTHRLTAPQLICMRELREARFLTPSELAHAVSLSQATITGILDRLERRELVQRTRNPADKRRVIVELTEAGLAAVEAAPLPLHARFAKRLAALPADEQAQIEHVLGKIVQMMEAEDIDAAPMLVDGAMSDDADMTGPDPEARRNH